MVRDAAVSPPSVTSSHPVIRSAASEPWDRGDPPRSASSPRRANGGRNAIQALNCEYVGSPSVGSVGKCL